MCGPFRELHNALDAGSEVTYQLGEVGRGVEHMTSIQKVSV
jgi:hypothetical protein